MSSVQLLKLGISKDQMSAGTKTFNNSLIFICEVHRKRGPPDTKKTAADHHHRTMLQRSRSEKDLAINMSAHVSKYYAKHPKHRKDHEAKAAANEEAAAANEEAAAAHVQRSRAVLQTANRLAIMLRFVTS